MIISVVNQKGGVAKTTSTLNIAALIAEEGKKVLMVDLDPQSSLSISLGIELSEPEKSMYNVMCNGGKISDVILEVKENLFIAPSTINLSLADLQLVNEMARESILQRALEEIENKFDYILIDCPPSLGLLVVNALNASDKVMIPCATDYLAYKGLILLIDTLGKVKKNLNPNIEILGIIATLYDKRTKHAKEVLEELKENYNVLGTVGISVQVKDAILANEALVDFNSKHPIVEEYRRIAEVILNVK